MILAIPLVKESKSWERFVSGDPFGQAPKALALNKEPHHLLHFEFPEEAQVLKAIREESEESL